MQLSQSESGFVLDVLNRSDIIAIIGKKKKKKKTYYINYQLLDNNQNSDMYFKKKLK